MISPADVNTAARDTVCICDAVIADSCVRYSYRLAACPDTAAVALGDVVEDRTVCQRKFGVFHDTSSAVFNGFIALYGDSV